MYSVEIDSILDADDTSLAPFVAGVSLLHQGKLKGLVLWVLVVTGFKILNCLKF
jgi:hypothetical protein